MVNQRLLAIPHVGTSLGHLVRMARYLEAHRAANTDVYVMIPKWASSYAQQLLPAQCRLIEQSSAFAVTSTSGVLSLSAISDAIDEYCQVVRRIQPNYILGSPGVEAAIVGYREDVPWTALCHGCFLPIPPWLVAALPRTLATMAESAWLLAGSTIDSLIPQLTNGRVNSWSELAALGHIVNMDSRRQQLPSKRQLVAFQTTSDDLVITRSSGEPGLPPRHVLEQLAPHYNVIYVTGRFDAVARHVPRNVSYVQDKFSYRDFIHPNTPVLTHGGFSTLQDLRHVKSIVILPGDLDQLCNAFIAKAKFKRFVSISPNWSSRLSSKHPFQRYTDWIFFSDSLSQTHGAMHSALGIASHCTAVAS